MQNTSIPRDKLKVGMRLVSASAAESIASPITVTEMTEAGFRYKLDERKHLHWDRWTEGGEMYTHGGKLEGYRIEAPTC